MTALRKCEGFNKKREDLRKAVVTILGLSSMLRSRLRVGSPG